MLTFISQAKYKTSLEALYIYMCTYMHIIMLLERKNLHKHFEHGMKPQGIQTPMHSVVIGEVESNKNNPSQQIQQQQWI